MRELDVPASRPAFHAPGRVLSVIYLGETSRGRLRARQEGFEGGKREAQFCQGLPCPNWSCSNEPIIDMMKARIRQQER